MTSRLGRVSLAILGGLAVVLIVIELALGAPSFGQPHLANPCTAKPVSTGSGFNGLAQRFARAALYGAACQLHTTREELVLSFVPAAGTKRIRWDRSTLDAALQAGLARAAHEVAGSGLPGQALALALRKLFAPTVAFLLQQAR